MAQNCHDLRRMRQCAASENVPMSFILLLLTVAIFIVLELAKSSNIKKATAAKTLSIESPVATSVIERYFHPGHSWALVGKSDVVTIGVDDLAQRCIGRIDAIDLPLVGRPVSQGQVLATLRRGSRSLASVAPITGVVVEINEKVVNRPSLINESPYDRGWVVKISPTSLRVELRNLLRGIVAERWMEAVRAELVHWFSPRMGTVLQDGGGLIDNISDLVSDREWEQLVNEFFPLVMSSRINLNP